MMEKLWARVAIGPPDKCWEWMGLRLPDGYGKITYNGKRMTAHRLAYISKSGAIPDGMFVCHTCDNPPCCNPAHLWLGTPQDNIRDMIAKGRHITAGRTHCPEGHELSKENTLFSQRRGRECRICYRAKERKRDKIRRDKHPPPRLR